MPFDKTTSYEQTCEMFARIIEKYAGQTMNCQNITSLMYVLLSILEDGLGRENFTYYNLSIIVDHLVRTSGSRRGSIEAKNLKEFLSWIEQELHIDAEGFIENRPESQIHKAALRRPQGTRNPRDLFPRGRMHRRK